MSQLTYEASVYTRNISYKNFKGETKAVDLHFALDPIQLMQIIASIELKNPTKRSGNPAARNAEPEMTDEAQLKFVRELAAKSAGFPSDDGESWEPFEDFADTIAGKAFLTKLASSDADRREFSQKVILSPFRSFVEFAKADPDNKPHEVKQFEEMMLQIENIFKEPDAKVESLEERRERLKAEMAELGEGS